MRVERWRVKWCWVLALAIHFALPANADAAASVELFDRVLLIRPESGFDMLSLRVTGPGDYEGVAWSSDPELWFDLVEEGQRLGADDSEPGPSRVLADGDYRYEVILWLGGEDQQRHEGWITVDRGTASIGGLPSEGVKSKVAQGDPPVAGLDGSSESDWFVIFDDFGDGSTELELQSDTAADALDRMVVQNVGGTLRLSNYDQSEGFSRFPRMTVLPTGQVGIGTTIPQADLHIFRPGGRLRITDSDPCPNPDASWEIEEASGRLMFEVVANCGGDNVGPKFYLHGNGNVGIGTADPLTDLQINGSFPEIRLNDTDSDSGKVDLKMDINHFEIQGTTGQGILNLDSRAPDDAFWVDLDGRVGIGALSGGAALEVRRSDGAAQIFVNETNGGAAARTLFRLSNRGNTKFEIDEITSGNTWAFTNSGNDFRVSLQDSGEVEFRVDNSGDAFLAGALTQNSDVNAKASIRPVDHDRVLRRLDALPISQWQYRDAPGVDHMGPMAQDFHAAFELGASETGISSIDTGGVALAAIQALNRKLERRNAELEERLEFLEAALARLLPDSSGD